MKKITQFILPTVWAVLRAVVLSILLGIVLLGCPTEAPKDKDKSGRVDVSAIIQSSLWEDDAEKDCDAGNTNSGNANKTVYLFDTEGKFYSINFGGLQTIYGQACSNAGGWYLNIPRSDIVEVIENANIGIATTYSVSGNTISLTSKSRLEELNSTMTFSTSNGGTLTHSNGKEYTKMDAGSD